MIHICDKRSKKNENVVTWLCRERSCRRRRDTNLKNEWKKKCEKMKDGCPADCWSCDYWAKRQAIECSLDKRLSGSRKEIFLQWLIRGKCFADVSHCLDSLRRIGLDRNICGLAHRLGVSNLVPNYEWLRRTLPRNLFAKIVLLSVPQYKCTQNVASCEAVAMCFAIVRWQQSSHIGSHVRQPGNWRQVILDLVYRSKILPLVLLLVKKLLV